MTFALEDMERNIEQLESDFPLHRSTTSDVQLMQLKNENAFISKRFNKMSEKYESILQSPITNADTLMAIKDVGKRYVKLDSMKHNFVKAVNDEVSKRKLDKDLHHNKSHLNINLEKFPGYESPVDYYTFRDNFEKIYLQSIPTEFLSDLLKNNFLAEQASPLVRIMNNINKIWQKLKSAYGDTKTTLSSKLQTLSKSHLKSRDPEKVIYAISTFTNILHELILLASKHGIEANLYYEDALPKIYQQLGDRRLTRFLSSISEEEPNEKETWQKLLKSLKKEEKLQQQKLIINKGKKESYFSPNLNEPHCHICGESAGSSEHIATFAPGGLKIIQYFTCKTFTEKAFAALLNILRDKGFCYQCLLPGANSSQGKHHEGRCQRDFICPHPIHNKYPVKNHALVCDKHKDDAANQEVLEQFKERCMKSSNLPSFSREIKLAFQTEHTFTSKSSKD